MAIDPRLMLMGADLADGVNGTNADDLMALNTTNPQFADTQFNLPPLGLNVDALTSNVNSVGNIGSQNDKAITEEVNRLIESDDPNDEMKALVATAVGNRNSLEEGVSDYKEFSDLVDSGPGAVEQFVREYMGASDSKESVPDWALPMTVFGLTLSGETGDWRQAILKARAKTGAAMFQKGQTDKAKADALNLQIKEKALDIYTTAQQGKQLSAKDAIGFVKDGVDPSSLKKFMDSGNPSDLTMLPDKEDVADLLDKFTSESVAKFQKSNDYNDLVRYVEPESDDLFDLLDTFTPESIDTFKESGVYADLVPKDADAWTPTVGGTAEAEQQADLKTMETVGFRNQVRGLDETGKIKKLRDYALLHAQTTRKVMEKTPSGDILRQRLPLGIFSVEAYAQDIGLDMSNPEVGRILNIAQVSLPYAKPEDINRLGALRNVKDKVSKMGAILEATPGDVTGVAGFVFNTDAARIAADLIPGFDVPVGATFTQVFESVAEVDLIEEILKESRFSDQDRKLVKDFITGRNFASLTEKKLRHAEVMKIIDRNLNALEFNLENFQTPPGMTDPVVDTETGDARLDTLRNLILDAQNGNN